MRKAGIIAVAAAVWAGVAGAALNPFGPLEGLSGLSTSSVPVTINGRDMEYNRARKLVTWSGNVVVVRGGDELRADTMQLNTVTHEIEARGRVVFTHVETIPAAVVTNGAVIATNAAVVKPASVWRGEVMRYNLSTGIWQTGAFESYFDPFFVRADESNVTNKNEFLLQNAVVTTCTNAWPRYHYSFTCRRMHVSPGNWMKGRGSVVRLGRIPVFYFPYWYRSLGDRSVGFSLEAGFRNRMGAFLLTTTKYWMAPGLRGITELDYRTKRGPAVGQEVDWFVGTNGAKGKVYGYYLNDQGVESDPHYGDPSQVDAQRYRLRLQQSNSFSDRDQFLADMNYLSDRYVMEDFFNREHRSGYQPQNYAVYTHRGEDMTLSMGLYKRFNDFFTAVDRLPDLTLDMNRQQLGESPFYYEGRNSAAYLQRLFDVTEHQEDYSAARLDTAHTVYWPTRHFGFLNVTPRGGYRATYYSETVARSSATQLVNVVTTNLVTGAGGLATPVLTAQTQTNVTPRVTNLGADVRSLVELGVETSFRMFKVLDNDNNRFGRGLRHVVEPYANYTFIPKPNLTPDQLYQFDSIDTLDKNDSVTFGVHNRLQTRHGQRVDDIMDVNLFTTYNFEDKVGRPFSDLGMNSEFHLAEWCQLYADAAYDTYASALRTFSMRSRLTGGAWRADVEHRHRENESDLLTTDIAYAPNRRWEFGLYDRYEFEQSRLEEQGVFATHILDCLSYRVGVSYLPAYTRSDGSEEKSDYRITFILWLNAFPNIRVGSAPRN